MTDPATALSLAHCHASVHCPGQELIPARVCSSKNRSARVQLYVSTMEKVHSFSCSLSSLSLSSNSHISSSVNVFFFLPSFSFFSTSLMAFLASLADNF